MGFLCNVIRCLGKSIGPPMTIPIKSSGLTQASVGLLRKPMRFLRPPSRVFRKPIGLFRACSRFRRQSLIFLGTSIRCRGGIYIHPDMREIPEGTHQTPLEIHRVPEDIHDF
eukprot:4392005-Pyramimonas_sp.AAC.1